MYILHVLVVRTVHKLAGFVFVYYFLKDIYNVLSKTVLILYED